MRSSAATVLSFEEYTVRELHAPRIAKTFETAINQVKPLFAEWSKAEITFEKNTLEVAKAVAGAYAKFKDETPTGTKAHFARYFDESIPADALVKDLVSNATFNRINYLLNKVIPAADGRSSDAARERIARREKALHRQWKQFQSTGTPTVESVKALLEKVLSVFMTESSVEKILA